MKKLEKSLLLVLIIILVPIAFMACCIKALAQLVVSAIECFEEEVLVPITNSIQEGVDEQ